MKYLYYFGAGILLFHFIGYCTGDFIPEKIDIGVYMLLSIITLITWGNEEKK